MRTVFATCSVDYSGRLDAHLPVAPRLIMVKADGSVLIHSDGGSYKPLNWMTAPCTMRVTDADTQDAAAGVNQVWTVSATKSDDTLVIRVHDIHSDVSYELGVDPGLVKDGVEAHLQELLAQQVDRVARGSRLVRREYPTAIGPVDLLVRDCADRAIAVEIKRVGGVDGVEQLTRYLNLLERDSHLAPVRGVFAAQTIRPQARVLAEDRGIECLVLDYDELRGVDNADERLF